MFSDEIQFADLNGRIVLRDFGLIGFRRTDIVDEQREQMVNKAVRCEPLDVLCEKLDIIKEG